jgi:hypothetical protein
MRKVLIVLSLAAIAVIAFAATAQAHTLSLRKANAVSAGVAKKDCQKDVYCTDWGSFKSDCNRASLHRVRCHALTVGTRPDGTQYGCDRPVLVKMKRNFDLIYVTGNKTCFPI